MSKISLTPNASGTGTFTIASPNGNTDRTINLPDASGTVQVSGNPISGTTGTFSGNVTLGSSVLATPTGSAPSYTCRAWVNFNGTGTVAIRASGNVSSITDNGTGNYTVNFSTAMPDANYGVLFALDSDFDTVNQYSVPANTRNIYTQQSLNTSANFRLFAGANSPTSSSLIDMRAVHVAIFR